MLWPQLSWDYATVALWEPRKVCALIPPILCKASSQVQTQQRMLEACREEASRSYLFVFKL